MPLISTKPLWATNNPVDGVSGQSAIIEPGVSKKNSGFLRIERPPRQDLNWLFNLLSNMSRAQENLLSNHIDGFELNQFVDEGAGAWSFEVSKGHALSTDKAMYFNTDIDTGWPGPVLKKFITGGNFIAGDGNSGLATGLTLTTNTWYHVFVIRLPSGSIDVGFDSDVNADNLATSDGVTQFRRIFSFRWNSSASPLRFIQQGDYFYRVQLDELVDSNMGIGPGETIKTQIINGVPLGVRTIADVRIGVATGATGTSYIHFIGDNQEHPATPSSITGDVNIDTSVIAHKKLPFDGVNNLFSAKVDNTPVGASISTSIKVIGYTDTRGKS